jgi:hypothetical protein
MDAAEEYPAGLLAPALEDGIRVSKKAGRFIGRDVQRRGIHTVKITVAISTLVEVGQARSLSACSRAHR